MTARRLGILGGTFDPIHCGHVEAARAAESALRLTEVLVIPSSFPPHRPQPLASSYHRFAMVALAMARHARWRTSDMELRESGVSFTASTLDRLHAEGYAATELFFIVGADAFDEIESWRDYPAILDRAHFAVVSRAGVIASEAPRRLPGLASRMVVADGAAPSSLQTTSIFLIDAPTADVSSTAIRSRRGARLSIAGLVSDDVQQYIDRHGLYTEAAPDANDDRVRTNVAAGRLHEQN